MGFLKPHYILRYLISLSPAETEDGQKDVDHVDVQLDGAVDMLFGADLVLLTAHDHLRVVDEKHGEEEGHEAAVDQVEDAVAGGGKDDGDDAEDEEDPDGGEEVHAPARDVELGLEGEEGESETESCSDSHSHHHPPGVVVGGNTAGHEGEGDGEDKKADDVSRALPAHPVATDDGDVGNEEHDVGHAIDGHPARLHHPAVGHGKGAFSFEGVIAVQTLDGRHKDDDPDDECGQCQLGE